MTQAIAVIFNQHSRSNDADYDQRIEAPRQALKGRAIMLGHHYQRADVYKRADLTGDSLRLSSLAAQADGRHIVCCGANFMVEANIVRQVIRKDPPRPARCLESLVDGNVVNDIPVTDRDKQLAGRAAQSMLDLS